MGKKSKKMMGANRPEMGRVVYNGPAGDSQSQERVETMTFCLPISVGDVAVGNVVKIKGSVTSNTVASCTGWSSITAFWNNYRVVGIHLVYSPKAENATFSDPNAGMAQAGATSPFFIMPFHNGMSDITNLSWDTAVNHAGRKFKPYNKTQKLTVKETIVEEAQWIATTSTTLVPFGFKYYFESNTFGATDPITIGSFTVTFTVQFSGRTLDSISKTQQAQVVEEKKEVPSSSLEDVLRAENAKLKALLVKASWYDVTEQEAKAAESAGSSKQLLKK